MKHKKIFQISLDAILLSLLIISAQISMKVGLVTFTFQLFTIYLIAFLCDLKHSGIILTCYIIMGLMGLPVFGASQGGLSYVLTSTFGFVYGFYAIILMVSLAKKLSKEHKNLKLIYYTISSLVSLIILYIIGFIHGYLVLNLLNGKGYSLNKLFALFIAPYIPFDLLKIALSLLISERLYPLISKFFLYYHFKSIDSTSTYLKRNYKKLDNLTFVSADYQEAGKGRMGRKWESSSNENLMFSFLIKDAKLIDKYASISLASAVSIFKVLKKLKVSNVSLKWPNDVYVDGKKICGILLESVSENNQISCLIVGIGLNLNVESFPEEIAKKATSYFLETNKKISLSRVKRKVYKELQKSLNEIKKGNSSYLDLANEYNYLKNKEVYAEYLGERVLVKVLNINPDNSLKVLVNNIEKDIFTGEITFHLS